MKTILKRNQLVILVIALVLVTAGYLNYNSNQSIGGGIRLNHLSGVYLDKPPYNIVVVVK